MILEQIKEINVKINYLNTLIMKKYHFVNLPALIMLFIGLAFPTSVISQTLEDAYLESLPPGLAELVQDSTQTNKDNGGSDVQRSYMADTAVDYDEKVLADLYKQLDELSQRLESSKPSYQLKRFGDNFFPEWLEPRVLENVVWALQSVLSSLLHMGRY